MSSWTSKPSPDERRADRADRAASREAINNARNGIQIALKTIKQESSKEDYPVIQKIGQDMLDWLKANPTTNQDDINDYSTNMIQQNPLFQSMRIRKDWADKFTQFQSTTDSRMKELGKKYPKLVGTAQELLNPMIAYRDTLLSWFKNGQTRLLPQDYEDKAVEIKEAVSGADGKDDNFNVQIFMDNTKLEKEKIRRDLDSRTVNIPRLIKTIVYITLSIVILVVLGWGFFLGASYATNLNIDRPFGFRLFYAMYGALFFLIVVPYQLIYKRWWLGKPLKMQGYIPLFDGPLFKWSWIGQNVFFFLEKKTVIDMEG